MSDAIPDWVHHRAQSLPSELAIEVSGERLTYSDLGRRVDALAGALKGRGLEPGDRVAVLAQNSIELVEAAHAVARAGAILVPLNARLSTSELAFQIGDSGARLVLCHPPTEEQARKATASVGARDPIGLPLDPGKSATLVDAHAAAGVHSIIYTSGTTGTPKGAMLTFANFFASASASAFNLGVAPGDRWLACMPLFHVGGLSILLRSAIYGTCAVVHEGFDERAVNRALREEGITLLSVVPTMLQRMLEADERAFPSTVRAVLVGGGPVTRPLLERALARGLPVAQTYGLTEAASQVTTLSAGDAVARVGSAGKPLVSSEVRVDAPPGEAGEILVRGSTVMTGYWNNPAATAVTLRDGWLHTGDIGRLDADGFLYVLDRRDDLVVTGGENVYPAEVEAVLLAHPGVIAAAVVGIPDERWGQVVAAALVTASGEVPPGLEDHLRESLAGYKRPRVLRCVPALPLTASGKVQRRLVGAMLSGR